MLITTDKSKIDIKQVQELLNQTYWASNRSYDSVNKSIEHSECIAVLERDALIGFSRMVTDYSTMFWVCDVVVSREFRGKGIGKMMMTYLSEQPYYKELKGILATKDAFGLYEQYGFKRVDTFMSKDRGIDGHS